MSFGSLSGAAVEAINRGAVLAGCLQNTGEGGVSPYHQFGGELIWQIGTSYFGCRDDRGRFSLDRAVDVAQANPIRAIEIKRRTRSHDGHRMHPGSTVSHRALSVRDRHAESLADARPRSNFKIGTSGQLRGRLTERAATAEPRLRPRSSRQRSNGPI